MADTIKAWSFSALSVFEECPRHAKLARLDKIPELPRPPPPKGNEHANDRGNRVHDKAEFFVKGETPLISELRGFEPEFEHLRQQYKKGTVSLEHMWCFNRDWQAVPPKDFANTWLRVKLDALNFLNRETAAVIDYKTGKKWGNEVKHAQQAQLYQLAAFMKYPQLQTIYTEFWYLDQNDISTMKYTRSQGIRYWKSFNSRGVRMTSEKEFKAKPNARSCRFCPYAPEEFSNKWVNKNGACQYGVS